MAQKRKKEEEDLVKGALKIGRGLAKRVTDNLKPNLLGVRVPNPVSKTIKNRPKVNYSNYDGIDEKPPAGRNQVKPAEVKPTQPPISASEQKTTTTRPPAAKSESKADSKPAAKASETYREGGKGLYQGTQEYRDKVGGSGNPLLNRFRRDMGRDAKTGERQYSTPEDKSKYVDKNGQLKIKDESKPNSQPVAAKTKPNPPTSKTGGNTPITASKPIEGGTPFKMRNVFETPEQRRRRLALEGRASK